MTICFSRLGFCFYKAVNIGMPDKLGGGGGGGGDTHQRKSLGGPECNINIHVHVHV